MEDKSFMDPEYVPPEYKVPYDIIELPSQGILYSNGKSSVKVEYLTAYDENILTSPNILNNGKFIDILLKNKVKDLGFDVDDLIGGDRIAILLFLRATGLGNEYKQLVIDKSGKIVEGTIDLATLKPKKLSITPDNNKEFDFILPKSEKKIKFRLLSGKDESEINTLGEENKEKNNGISTESSLRLERCVMEIDGVRDKMKISHALKIVNLLDIRKLKKYISEIEPGIDFNTTARIQGGESVSCFLRLGRNFWDPEI
jgi:hypothetical protein